MPRHKKTLRVSNISRHTEGMRSKAVAIAANNNAPAIIVVSSVLVLVVLLGQALRLML